MSEVVIKIERHDFHDWRVITSGTIMRFETKGQVIGYLIDEVLKRVE